VALSELDKRKKLFKGLCAWGSFEEFPAIYPDRLPGWAQRIAGEFGWRLSPAAAELLASTYGDDLFAVRQTIERATLFLGAQRRIEVADIEPMLAGEGMHSVFLLLDAVSSSDLARALAIVRSLFAGEDHPPLWLSALASLLTRLLKLLELNEPNDVRASQLTGIKPFFMAKSRAQAEHFGREGLTNGILACYETEWATRTSPLPERLAWEILAWRLCRKTPLADFALVDSESTDFGE
jgi:DNA polymerase-3 subunit delta